MTATTTRRPPRAPAAGAGGSPGRLVTGIAVRQVRRGTLVVTLLAGLLPAFVAIQYRSTFEGTIGPASLAALADNPAIRTLFGPAVALDDAGGFTVWRLGTVLGVLVGVWAALTGTRTTRAEEEAGRWDLLLGGRLSLPTVVRRHLGVLLVAAALPGAALAVGLLLAGTAALGAVLFGAALAGIGMTGAALGVLAAQLAPERRTASGMAVAVLLTGLLMRMVGDGVPALAWLHWFSPFGLLGRVEPYAGDRPLPVLVLLAMVAVAGSGAVVMAGGRDVGRGRLAARDTGRRASRLLRSLPGLAVHRMRRPVLAWGAGLGAYFLLIGLLATSMIDFLRENRAFADMAAQAGFAQLGSVQGYVAALFALLAVPLGAFAATRIAATAADERAGRLSLLYASPVGRVRWVLTETAAGAGAVLLLAAIAGLATWAGAAWVGAGLGPGEALAGALSVVPVALLCLGAALAALGWAPSAVLGLGVLPAAGGYLLLVLADSFRWPAWVGDLSPFTHLAAVPAEPWDVAGAVVMMALAAVLAAAGLTRYGSRDLRG
ncbi:ABC transporter permease [Blastococcus saxobsidens]|uniref:ABC-2 type transport system permease protein n=1 Tax=Blastococcus saxobsidens TaxID=138336 RepID=A0A4Q7Y8B5_9ACTN|nr:polyketide antibiotic transporter [Blastococcus saxobsidens]RZU32968.1 ABC-2 type transport system permease protein [Blastococcus saxobsidens]